MAKLQEEYPEMAETTEQGGDMDGDKDSPTGRVSKKKHYPFGTPSHERHPFSTFAHLKGQTQDFARQIATATGIEPEIVEDKPRRVRKAPKKLPNEAADLEQHAELEEIPDAEGVEPCTRPACLAVLKSLAEITAKNLVDRMDLEDECERLQEENLQLEEDVRAQEGKLEKLNDIGILLESNLERLISRVEQLESTKENLHLERNEANNKVSSDYI